jgi:hypothetical protein
VEVVDALVVQERQELPLERPRGLPDRPLPETPRAAVVEVAGDRLADRGDVGLHGTDTPGRLPPAHKVGRGIPRGEVERLADDIAREGPLNPDRALATPLAAGPVPARGDVAAVEAQHVPFYQMKGTYWVRENWRFR